MEARHQDRFHQVRELVQWASAYHERLAGQFRSKAKESDTDARLRMALGYVAEHEDNMHKELEQYLGDDSDHHAVLETWFEDAVEAPTASIDEVAPDALQADTVQDVLYTTLDSHKALMKIYEERAKGSPADSERELFDSLITQYKAEQRRFARNMQRLEDY